MAHKFDARLAALERRLSAQSEFSGGRLYGEQWPGPLSEGVPPVGMFRCSQLDNPTGDLWTGWGDPAAYHYTQAELEERARAKRCELLLVVYSDDAVPLVA